MANNLHEWSLGRQSALWFGGLLAVLAAVLVAVAYAVTVAFAARMLDEEAREIADIASAKLVESPAAARSLLELIVEENQQLDVLLELRSGGSTTYIGKQSLRGVRTGGFQRRVEVVLDDGRELVVAIDGHEWQQPLSRFRWLIALVVLGFTAILLCASLLFGRKMSRMLKDVVRSVEESGRPVSPRGTPKEIADVTRAVSAEFDRLERAQARIQLLIAGAAHELRSPVQSMLTRVQVAIRRPPGPQKLPPLLADQEQELVDLARRVDNLVLLSADAQDRLPMESFDWTTELDLRLSSDVVRAARSGVCIAFTTPESLLLEGNRESLVLAVRNLIANAVRFSSPGGRVLVTSAMARDGFVRVTVDDAGPGVPVSEREAVFEAMRRGEQHMRGGYGLGLALVRRTMQDHGGRAWTEDSPMGGARFVLDFPCAQAADAST